MNTIHTPSHFRSFFAVLDLLALNAIHGLLLMFLHKIPAHAQDQYFLLLTLSNVIWLLSVYWSALYVNNAAKLDENFSKRTTKAYLIFAVCMLGVMFLYHFSYSRVYILASFGMFLTFLILTRILFEGAAFYLQNSKRSTKKVIILGYNELAKTLVQRFSTQKKNVWVSGYFEDERKVTELSTLPIIGDIDECVEYAKLNDIAEIYSTISPESNIGIYEMAQVAEKSFIRFKFVPDFKLYVNRNVHMEYLSEIPILSLRPEPLEDSENNIKKRVFDVIFSLLVVIFLLSWLVPLIAILIKLTSKGPVFFFQMRSGKNNKEFRCFKFRTLRINSEEHSRQVTINDARVTPLGKFLRKTNIDEIPQFMNVLIGDMSIIGPRPHMLRHTQQFSKIMNEYMIRHFLKPGISGWAQINGYRGEVKTEEHLRKRIEYDIWYMENWSLWLDIKIICLTIYSTFQGDKNAY